MLPRIRNRNVLVTAKPISIYAHARNLEAAYTRALAVIGRQEMELKTQKQMIESLRKKK